MGFKIIFAIPFAVRAPTNTQKKEGKSVCPNLRPKKSQKIKKKSRRFEIKSLNLLVDGTYCTKKKTFYLFFFFLVPTKIRPKKFCSGQPGQWSPNLFEVLG